MFNKSSTALLLTVALGGGAQAQTACPCNASTGTQLNTAAITTLLSNRMVCANVGSEQWQEWHNGVASGPVVDYKKGPGDKVDPSAPVGTYAVAADNTVTYTYGSQSYKYAVCQNGGSTTFCGAIFGGRDITGAVVGGSGLQACSGVSAALVAVSAAPAGVRAATATRTVTAKTRAAPASATTTKP